ncbi:mitochondrial fission process protein 1 [Aplysia californica]|uniref:Mitochondrial fission process protein 1 n=1 Tax=Aplysia californica TaxID=6500 RepID=A0ABM0K143_APLCA|nr:mitochondrial fission process protein 1 [Aplysia californica]
MESKTGNSEKKAREYDVFKDSLLRYLGYANEVGEAFRVLVPVSLVRLSYVVASTYVAADSVDKGYKMSQKVSDSADWSYKCKRVGIATGDTLVWQGFASVAVPGFTINRICWASRHVLSRVASLLAPVRNWSVVAIGLGCIPFIIKPIDRAVDHAMDATLRKLYENP